MKNVLNGKLLADSSFWQGKGAELPQFDREALDVRSVCFSAGRMAYGHTGDILQDVLNQDPDAGCMIGIETYGARYCAELAATDYLMTQMIFANEPGVVVPKIQSAIRSVLFVDDNTSSITWQTMMEIARSPKLQWATINAPEGAYGMAYTGGDKAEPLNDAVRNDMANGTMTSDPAKWTAFALERFKAGLKLAFISCTNFSSNGHVTGAVIRTMARSWEEKGHAPKGFVDYLSDPDQFSFPNCMIDRIAVPPDAKTEEALANLGILSPMVVTEKTRYWVVEDLFPAGRPDFEKAEGVILASDYEEVKRYEDMKLRILNMSHSVIAGLGVLLGYQGQYGIYRAIQDEDIKEIITRIIDIVIKTIEHPSKMNPVDFARDAIERLQNPNIPDDPMRIALNASTKVLPRFMDTYYAGQEKGMTEEELKIVLLPVAGVLRYCMAIDDEGQSFNLEGDPLKDLMEKAGSAAKLGDSASASAFDELISHTDIMGKDLLASGNTGKTLQQMISAMIQDKGAVRKVVKEVLGK